MWLSAGQHNRKEVFYQPQVATRLADHHIVESNVAMFPLLLRSEAPLGGGLGGLTPNLSDVARRYLGRIGGEDEEVFNHALTMLHSPRLNAENAGALRMDWPRVPLPGTKEGLRASAMLGGDLRRC